MVDYIKMDPILASPGCTSIVKNIATFSGTLHTKNILLKWAKERKCWTTNRTKYHQIPPSLTVESIRSNSSLRTSIHPMLAQEAPASVKIRLRVTPTDGSSKQGVSFESKGTTFLLHSNFVFSLIRK
ncbi:hypothetical protein M0802_007308 [Mischocyttarus mexicanus]|nr:hypothetical protein M0802_007308 [Mischocyttarus mexicanus]